MSEIEEGIDSSRGGFQHTEAEVVEHFYRAGKTIECAHAVFPARNKATGVWFTMLMFFDQDNKDFSHAYRLVEDSQIESLIKLLYGVRAECRKRNSENK